MSIKTEISWRRVVGDDGVKMDVYARRFGGEWRFYQREKRHHLWLEIKSPAVGDWLTLLDAVERRVPRMLFHPDDVQRLRQIIRERHPDATLDG